MQTQREQIIVDGSPMNLVVARPNDDKPLPAVVVLQHQYGLDKFMEEMTGRFARDGFFAVCPDLYHRIVRTTGPPGAVVRATRTLSKTSMRRWRS